MDIRKLQRAIVDGLEDVKGQNIAVFNTEHLSPLFERVIIASGTSNRQTKALAASVRDAVKASGHGVLRTEGEANGEWIIVDCGAAVVHLMQPTIREYYHLEEIWGDKPVKMKIDSGPKRLAKASPVDGEDADDDDDSEASAAPRATRARKSAARAGSAAVEKKPAAKKTTAAAKAPVGRKTATAKTAPAAKSPARKAAARQPADDLAPSARKTVRRSAPVRIVKIGEPAARKTAPRKAAAGTGVTRTTGVKRSAGAAQTTARPAAKKAVRRA